MDAEQRQRLEAEVAEMRALDTLRNTGPAGAALANVYARTLELQEMLRPQVTVQPTAVPAPEVVVNVPEQRQEPPQVTVAVPDQTEALRLVASALTSVVEIIGAWYAHETAPEMPSRKDVTFKRNNNGQITGATVTEAADG